MVNLQVNWQTLIAEDDHDVLEWAGCVNNNRLVLCYLHDVKVSACLSVCLLMCFSAILHGTKDDTETVQVTPLRRTLASSP